MRIRTTAKALRERMTKLYDREDLEVVPIDLMLYVVYDHKDGKPVYYGTQERCRSWAAYHTKGRR